MPVIRFRSLTPHRLVAATCGVALALAGVHLMAQWIAVGDLAVAWGSFTSAWTTRPILLGLGWLAISVAVSAAVAVIHRRA